MGSDLCPALQVVLKLMPNAWPGHLAQVMFDVDLVTVEDICEPLQRVLQNDSTESILLLQGIMEVTQTFSPLQRLRCLSNMILLNVLFNGACSSAYSHTCCHLLLGAPGSLFRASAEASQCVVDLFPKSANSEDAELKVWSVGENEDEENEDSIDLDDIGTDEHILRGYARALNMLTHTNDGIIQNHVPPDYTERVQKLKVTALQDGDNQMDCTTVAPVAAFFVRWATQVIVDGSTCDLSLLGSEAATAIQYWLGQGEDAVPRYIKLWKELLSKCSVSSDWLRLSCDPAHIISEFGITIAEAVPPVAFIFTFCLYIHLQQLSDKDFFGKNPPLPLATEMSHTVLFLQALTARLSAPAIALDLTTKSDELFAPFLRLSCHRLLGHLMDRHERNAYIRNTTSLNPEIAAYLEEERQLKKKQEEEYQESLRLDAEREEKRRLARIEIERKEEEAKRERDDWKTEKVAFSEILSSAAASVNNAAKGTDLCHVRVQFRDGIVRERQFFANNDVSILWKWAAVELDEETHREITFVSHYPRKVLTEASTSGQ